MQPTIRFRDGDEMPALGLGTWKYAPGAAGAAVESAIRCGYRHIDCAASYGDEAEVGEALARCFDEGLVRREELWVTSKLWCDSHAPEDVTPALERSLADLRLDALDLYLVHWPIALRKGVEKPTRPADLIPLAELPLAETWRGMEGAADAGLARHLGVSNFSEQKLRALVRGARVAPEVNQVELHPYNQQPALVAACRELGVHNTAFAPLGSRDRPADLKTDGEPVLLEDPVVASIAAARGATPAQVALAWSLAQGFAVIPKAAHADHQRENLAAQELELGEEDLRRLAALDRGHRYVDGGYFLVPDGPYTRSVIWDE